VASRLSAEGLEDHVPVIVFEFTDGTQQKVDAASGASLMQAAVSHGVDAIVAECGGNAACATCHVYVDASQIDLVGGPNDVEDEMLDFAAAERRDTSRLSCQIEVSEDLDGLIVHLPEEQV
jgi:2Fe-2S ferredoxin